MYRQTGPGGLPLALRLSEGLGRIRAEDLVDFHADQALETWQIKVYPWELLSEPLPCLSFGSRSLNGRRNDWRCARCQLMCVSFLMRLRRSLLSWL